MVKTGFTVRVYLFCLGFNSCLLRELTASQLFAIATSSDTGSHNRQDLIHSFVPTHYVYLMGIYILEMIIFYMTVHLFSVNFSHINLLKNHWTFWNNTLQEWFMKGSLQKSLILLLLDEKHGCHRQFLSASSQIFGCNSYYSLKFCIFFLISIWIIIIIKEIGNDNLLSKNYFVFVINVFLR